MYLLISTLLVFGATFFLIYGIGRLFTGQRRQVLERVDKYTRQKKSSKNFGGPKTAQINKGLKPAFQHISVMFAPKGFSRKVETELNKADLPLKGEEFVLINLIAGIVPALLGYLILQNIGVLIAFGAIGFIMPRILLKRAISKRLKTFNGQIGDALVIMSNSLRAGFSFLQSMEMVSKEMPSPIADEFKRVIREMNLGTPTEEALVNITRRIESEDLDLVITAVLIQRQIGGNLSEVLDNISQTIRERIRIKGEIKTLTAQGRVSGLIVGLLPVGLALILFLINPAYIGSLFNNAIGLMLLGVGIVSQMIGFLAVRKIVNIEI